MNCRTFLTLWITWVLLGCSTTPDSFRATVTKVYSGDLIRVTSHSGACKIKLAYIDAPATYQAHGESSRQFLSDQILLKDILVIPVEKHKGSVIAEVIDDDAASVNQRMVAEGHAWQERDMPADSLYSHLMRQAKKSKAGLWADYTAIPPWVWDRLVYGPGRLTENTTGSSNE